VTGRVRTIKQSRKHLDVADERRIRDIIDTYLEDFDGVKYDGVYAAELLEQHKSHGYEQRFRVHFGEQAQITGHLFVFTHVIGLFDLAEFLRHVRVLPSQPLKRFLRLLIFIYASGRSGGGGGAKGKRTRVF